MNLQVIASPDGDIVWVSGPLPGAPVLGHGADRPEDRRGHRRHRLGVSGGLPVARISAAAAPVGLG